MTGGGEGRQKPWSALPKLDASSMILVDIGGRRLISGQVVNTQILFEGTELTLCWSFFLNQLNLSPW